MGKIKKQIAQFIEDPDVVFFHVGKCTANSAEEAVYNRWNTTYSRGYSGITVVYEDSEVNSALAAARWSVREARQIQFEKDLHRTFNQHEKWIPQSTEKTGSVAETPKKTLCLYIAYRSTRLDVIDWSPDSTSNNNNKEQITAFSRPPPSTPTKFASEPIVGHAARVSSVSSNSHVTSPATVNKELNFDTPVKQKTSATSAGPRGLVGYEGTIADLKEQFDRDEIKRCKLKLLSGKLDGQSVVITKFNGTATEVKILSSGDIKYCATSNRIRVLSYS